LAGLSPAGMAASLAARPIPASRAAKDREASGDLRPKARWLLGPFPYIPDRGRLTIKGAIRDDRAGRRASLVRHSKLRLTSVGGKMTELPAQWPCMLGQTFAAKHPRLAR
jgi:hypothetical protein